MHPIPAIFTVTWCTSICTLFCSFCSGYHVIIVPHHSKSMQIPTFLLFNNSVSFLVRVTCTTLCVMIKTSLVTASLLFSYIRCYNSKSARLCIMLF
ncbi:hypothetical protein V8B55DRAFT_1115916 [Mucor lusitanicus]